MERFSFRWKVKDGLGHITRGEDSIELENTISQDELEEAITGAIGIGSNFVFKQELRICQTANECDESCVDWRIYKLRKRKETAVKPSPPLSNDKEVSLE
jgi:hypothetical protein